MKFIITLALFVVVAVSALPHKQMPRLGGSSGRINGGRPAVLGQFPYQAVIWVDYPGASSLCGGTLIGADWILTAAHCTRDDGIYEIYLGTIDMMTSDVQVGAIEAIRHPDYTGTSASNDIALIHLNTTVEFNENIQPVRLNGAFIGAGQHPIVSGWGATNNTSGGSQFLNWADLVTITNDECNSVYGGVMDGMICCTGGDISKSVCSGDSGGPLVLGEGSAAIHIGVVSFGGGCESGLPSGFSRTSFYRNWIRDVSGI